MATNPPVTLPGPDDAYTAFKTAEGTYTSTVASQANAAAALQAAQDAKTAADANLTSAQNAVKSAADTLIASLQAYETGLVAPAPAQSLPATS